MIEELSYTKDDDKIMLKQKEEAIYELEVILREFLVVYQLLGAYYNVKV